MTSYTISKNDVAGPFLRKLPFKMEAMKDLRSWPTPARARAWPKSFT